MFKEKIIPKILRILQAQSEVTVDLFDILTSGYTESYRKSQRTLKSGAPQFKTDWAERYTERQKFYSLLNQLKNQGLVEKKIAGPKKTIWKITKKGIDRLSFLTEKLEVLSLGTGKYKVEKDKNLKIIVFDIPEAKRHKRKWLRDTISGLGFSLLQRSVWIGKDKIPEEFIVDLRELDILGYVHIFEINKRGTISSAV